MPTKWRPDRGIDSVTSRYVFVRVHHLGMQPATHVTTPQPHILRGLLLHWGSEFTYLGGGVFIVSSQSFKCSLVYAKRSFYAAVNGLFGKLLILASELVGVGVEFNAPLDTI